MQRVPRLEPGSAIEAVASAGPPDVEKFRRGEAALSQLGFSPRVPKDLLARRQRYLAGSDEQRLAELQRAWQSDAPVVWAARGGYGTMHLLDRFQPTAQKLLIGFSDFTALGCALWKEEIPWIHGPLFTTIADEPPDSIEHLLAVAEGRASGRALSGEVLVKGNARGRLIGGSLSLLAALCGTKYFPSCKDAIVFLEDVGEQPYRVDRLFAQLQLAGTFDGAAGLALGTFHQCEPRDQSYAFADVLAELAGRIGLPCVWKLPFGHASPNFALPFGAMAELSAERLILREEITREKTTHA